VHIEDDGEIEGGAPSCVSNVVAAADSYSVVGEGTQAGGDVWVLSDAGGVFGEGDVAHVVAAILNAPMSAYPFVSAFGRDACCGRHPEDDLARLCAESGPGIALVDGALEKPIAERRRRETGRSGLGGGCA